MCKRNQNPGALRVLRPADLAVSGATFDSQVNAIVENRNEIVIHNIEHILRDRNITQAHMCNVDLQGTPQPPQIAAYKKIDRDIPFRTMARIALAYGYTPEELCGQLLDRRQPDPGEDTCCPSRPAKEHQKYIGTYQMAFFRNDKPLGQNIRTCSRSLVFGVMSIYRCADTPHTLSVLALTHCDEDKLDTVLQDIRQAETDGIPARLREEFHSAARTLSRAEYLYEGTLQLNERAAQLTLHQSSGCDTVHITLHNRAANSSEGSDYKGGLGVMQSMSRGEQHMPCVQSVLLSRRSLQTIAREELAQSLLLAPPRVELQDEVQSIITYMKLIFPGDGGETPLSQMSDADKAAMLESFIEKKLIDVIKRNLLHYYKISTEMDSRSYKRICR